MLIRSLVRRQLALPRLRTLYRLSTEQQPQATTQQAAAEEVVQQKPQRKQKRSRNMRRQEQQETQSFDGEDFTGAPTSHPKSAFNFQQRRKYKKREPIKTVEDVEFEALKQNVNADYLQFVNKKFDNQSVLVRFRKNVLQKTYEEPEANYVINTIEEYDKNLEKIFSTGTKEQQVKGVSKLAQRFMNDKEIFGTKNADPILSNYADYTPYKFGKITIKNRRMTEGEYFAPTSMKKSLKFIQSLGPEYAQNRALDDLLQQDQIKKPYKKKMTVADYGKILDVQNEILWRFSRVTQNLDPKASEDSTAQNTPDRDADELDESKEVAVPSEESVWADNMEDGLRLSPRVVEKIFELYTEGWTVRDLSQRFGILPNRVKFIVWSRAQFYLQILPRFGFKHFLECLELQKEYEKTYGYLEFGLDLPEMAEDDDFVDRIHCWNNNLVDVAKETDVERNQREQAMEKMALRTDFTKKYLMMDFATHGKGSYMYFLRDWKRMKGKGSDFWHLSRHTFKKLYKQKGRDRYC